MAFARDPWEGLSGETGWPRYSDDEESLVLVAVDNEPAARPALPRTYDVSCSDVTSAVEWGVDGTLRLQGAYALSRVFTPWIP